MMRSLPIVLVAGTLIFAPEAHARKRTQISPYLEIDQTALADLKNGGGVSTYTTFAAGVDASTSGPRVQGQVSARYEFRQGWGRNREQTHVVSGLARVRAEAVPNLLSIEGGALGTRLRTDIRGSAQSAGLGNPSNTSQLYSLYVGPMLATRVGALDVSASYRLGYSKVTNETAIFLPAGSARLGSFDSSVSHALGASVGMKSGTLPFGWTVSGAYERDDASQLDQRYEGKYVRADVVVPVTPTVALTAGAGYEKITASQRDALRDVAGNPVVSADGRYVTDSASPRRLSYDTSGFIWDVGVLWRPSRRTSLEAKVGRRYGGMTYIGDFSWQLSDDQSIRAGVYDGVTTFGQQVGNALRNVPTQFVVQRDPFNNQFSGCVFGAEGAGAGGCLSPALASAAQGVYRSRGVGAVWSRSRRGTTLGVAVGYNQRRFYAPPTAGFVINGSRDESFYAQASVAHRLDEASSIDGSVYANWYQSGLVGAPRVVGVGGTASYNRNFGPRFSGTAALGLYSSETQGFESSLVGAAQVGARYHF